MSIKVVIERHTIPGFERELNQALTEMRARAMRAKGYISGETLQAVEDPHHYLVISTWNDLQDWQAWASSAERRGIQAKIDAMLQSPATQRVFTYGG